MVTMRESNDKCMRLESLVRPATVQYSSVISTTCYVLLECCAEPECDNVLGIKSLKYELRKLVKNISQDYQVLWSTCSRTQNRRGAD